MILPSLIRAHMDPFNNECRAYGRLIEKGLNGKVAVRCRGYMIISAHTENEIHRRLGIASWDRPDEEEEEGSALEPLHAIIKDLVVAESRSRLRTLGE